MPAQNPVASRLSRDVIVDAYLRLVETEDNDSVSLRRLGSELGVDPTAVYRYFRDKDEILTAAADRLLAEVTDGLELSGGWRDQLRDLLLALRRVYLVHPRALLALQLAPPRLENGFCNVERCIALLREAGVAEDEVPIAYEALETYTIGATVFDARATEDEPRGLAPGLPDAAARPDPESDRDRGVALPGYRQGIPLRARPDARHDRGEGAGT